MAATTTADPVTGRIADLATACWALAAVAAATELGLTSAPGTPRTAAEAGAQAGVPATVAARLLDVLVAAGLAERAGSAYVTAQALAAPHLRAQLRSAVEQPRALAVAARDGCVPTAWEVRDPVVLQAQGDTSAEAVPLLEHRVLPALDGVLERLEAPGASLLDVGAGVCAMSIAMCRRWPALRVVALEPADAPAALAAGNIASAGMRDRIELRRELVQDLDEDAAHDLVWLPGGFLPPDVLAEALPAVHRALRPGGWVLTATLGGGGDDLPSATARLRATTWSGDALEPERVRGMLQEAGFVDVRLAPRTPQGLTPMFARRAPEGGGGAVPPAPGAPSRAGA